MAAARTHLPRDPWTRRALAAALAGAALGATGAAAQAPAWPERPVRLVTLAAPGGGSDAVARTLAEALARRWGQPVLVDNRPGADGIVAVEAFLAARDGLHTLLFANSSTVSVNPLLHERLPYDPVRDLLPLAFVVEDFIAVVAAPSLPAGSLAELVELVRARPAGALNWAAVPGSPHLSFLAFQRAAGVEMTFVAYRNPLAAIPDLTQGRVQVALVPLGAVLGQVRAGAVRALAVASPRRAPAAPEVPTGAEAGWPDLGFSGGLGLFAPRDMPGGLRARIAVEVAEALREPDLARRLTTLGYVPRGDGPEAFAAVLAEQGAHWAALARAHGVRPSSR